MLKMDVSSTFLVEMDPVIRRYILMSIVPVLSRLRSTQNLVLLLAIILIELL